MSHLSCPECAKKDQEIELTIDALQLMEDDKKESIRQQAARECAEIVEALRQQSSDVEARGAFAEARNAILRHFGIEGK